MAIQETWTVLDHDLFDKTLKDVFPGRSSPVGRLHLAPGPCKPKQASALVYQTSGPSPSPRAQARLAASQRALGPATRFSTRGWVLRRHPYSRCHRHYPIVFECFEYALQRVITDGKVVFGPHQGFLIPTESLYSEIRCPVP